MLFIELPTFIRSADGLLGDDELAEVQTTLLENPLAGDLISGGKGLRKLRVALPDRGKRGGARSALMVKGLATFSMGVTAGVQLAGAIAGRWFASAGSWRLGPLSPCLRWGSYTCLPHISPLAINVKAFVVGSIRVPGARPAPNGRILTKGVLMSGEA
ncbi:MAG: hypothetical protein IBX64_13980 [Actinobacteria bacterium]|nr:hypothetical protein [Actinomycetota bacterium]